MENNHRSRVAVLRALIAASPIAVAMPPRDFAEWCAHQPKDIDAVVLDWLRSQQPRPVALS